MMYAKPQDEMWILEMFKSGTYEAVRMILFERDEDTGARSVMDIFEVDRDRAVAHASMFAFGATEQVKSELNEVVFEDGSVVDFGRAKNPTSRMKKVLEQLVVREMEAE